MTSAELRLRGSALAPGVGLGRACFYQSGETRSHKDALRTNEAERLRESLTAVTEQLGKLGRDADIKPGRKAGDIFRAQGMMLDDPELQRALFASLDEVGGSAEAAVATSFSAYEDELQAAGTPYLRERACDLAELKQRLLERLATAAPYLRCSDNAYCLIGECRLGNDHVLVADRLTAGSTVEADQRTVGFLVESGGPSSHAAILARGLGLPAVSGLRDPRSVIPLDSRILVDGDTGEVFINPSADTLARYHQRLSVGCAASFDIAPAVPQLKVMANIGRIEDVTQALRAQAEGIGLYRTEVEALAKRRPLTEEEQTERYSELLDLFPGPVYIRLLDLGADKSADWLNLPSEDNPALGCRGARLLLARPQLLRAQARALARASRRRPIHVIYPMIVGEDQYLRLRSVFAETTADLSGVQLLHGVMFEVPAACLDAQRLLRHADFGRIGANDLMQYLFAADRTNDTLCHDELLDSPVFWEIVETLVEAAASLNKPLALCGEVASNPRLIPRILSAGIREISTHPRRIAEVRRAVQRCV